MLKISRVPRGYVPRFVSKTKFVYSKITFHCNSCPDTTLGMALTASEVDMLRGAAGARPDTKQNPSQSMSQKIIRFCFVSHQVRQRLGPAPQLPARSGFFIPQKRMPKPFLDFSLVLCGVFDFLHCLTSTQHFILL